MPDPREGIDWARLRVQAAQEHLTRLMAHRTHRTLGIAAIVGGVAALLAVLAAWAWIYWGLPNVPNGEALWALNRQPGITFLDRQGNTLGVRGPYYGQRVALGDLPSYVPEAFLAIEDRRFYEHRGVDRAAIMRALLANLSAGRTVQGGSTITQQLARNLFLTPRQTMRRKIQEMVLAARIEQLLSKDEILELYLNRVYLGEQAYGIDAASRRYFGIPATELSLAQAAMLAGLPKAPSRSAPSQNMEAARARQRLVLEAMVEAGFITAEQRDQAAAATIEIRQRPGEGSLGYVFDMAAEEANRILDGEPADLVIRTSIDAAVQRAAATAVANHLGARARGPHPLQAGFVAMDRDGGVRALVGGTNYAASRFNRVVQARRQPGSSFKAFVYAAALEEGFDTEDVRFDEPTVIGNWRPRNYDEGYRGAVTLRSAFALSINTIAAQVANEVGPREVANVATRFGIRTMPAQNQFVPPSIALGTVEVTLWDMTQAFSTFMREGQRLDAHLVDTIETSSGESLYHRPSATPQRVYDPELARRMTSMLGAVVLNGTGTRAQLSGRDVAGKTGTSQDWRDAWFIGYTADYTAGVWVGLDDYTPMSRVRGLGRITGGAIPAEIWRDVMTTAHRGLPARSLPGIEQPTRSPRQLELASFYDQLKDAFGFGDDDDEGYEDDPRPPPDDFFR